MDSLTLRPFEFHLPSSCYEEMKAHVNRLAPEEACGMVAGCSEKDRHKGDRFYALEVIPITNIEHSATRYRMDPHEQLRAFNHIEAQDQSLVGIYHSHFNGPDRPSTTDVAESYYPECVYLIWSRQSGEWICKTYLIQSGEISAVPLNVE
jgi:proteasome lid subunit RPN8/RPN11